MNDGSNANANRRVRVVPQSTAEEFVVSRAHCEFRSGGPVPRLPSISFMETSPNKATWVDVGSNMAIPQALSKNCIVPNAVDVVKTRLIESPA